MCCCKWGQYYLESIYWHCIEKHFCFDENIALYDEEETTKSTSDSNSDTNLQSMNPSGGSSCKASNNNIYDNMAFYDNVALIANRSIFIIEPKDTHKTDGSNLNVPPRPSSLSAKVDQSIHQQIFIEASKPQSLVITEQPRFTFGDSDSSLDLNRSENSLNSEATSPKTQKTRAQRDVEIFKSIPHINNTNASSMSSLATISEDLEANLHPNPNLLTIPHSSTTIGIVKMRKISLHERRVSKSLTLDIDTKRQEVPIIRQSSFPKFYIENPESNQNSSTIGANPILALETPVPVPHAFSYDLQTVVQLEKERQELEKEKHQLRRSVTNVKDNRRIQQIRDKLKPMKLLRGSSMQSIYSS